MKKRNENYLVNRKPETSKLYQWIVDFWFNNGYPPTVREIAAGCGIPSTSNVVYWLDHLHKVGLIERKEGLSRGYVPVISPEQMLLEGARRCRAAGIDPIALLENKE